MARPLCIEFPWTSYHFTSRGNRREGTYPDDANGRNWLNSFSNVYRIVRKQEGLRLALTAKSG